MDKQTYGENLWRKPMETKKTDGENKIYGDKNLWEKKTYGKKNNGQTTMGNKKTYGEQPIEKTKTMENNPYVFVLHWFFSSIGFSP